MLHALCDICIAMCYVTLKKEKKKESVTLHELCDICIAMCYVTLKMKKRPPKKEKISHHFQGEGRHGQSQTGTSGRRNTAPASDPPAARKVSWLQKLEEA